MWADNDISDALSQDTSDSGKVLKKGRRAGKRQAAGGDTTTSSENGDSFPRKKPSKKAQSSKDKRRKRKRKRDPEDMDTSDGGSDGETNVKTRKKQKTDDDRGEDEDGHKSKRVPSTSKRKSGGGSKVSEPDSQSDTGSSSSDSNSEEESKATRLISNSRKSIMSQPKKRAHGRSRSPLASLDDKVPRSAHVYRAVRQERVALGWSEAPCASCPVFDFCKERGPVGPSGCEYYGEWLKRATIVMDS